MKVFVASAMANNHYPYKLQKPSTLSERVVDSAEEFILDSGIGDDISNGEVLDLAEQYAADYVVAKDYFHDQEKTIKSINDFVELYSDHKYNGDCFLPLQPPYDEQLDRMKELGVCGDYYMLGGMAPPDISTQQQIRWIKEFRQQYPDVYAHGLGVGGGKEFVESVAGKGWLQSVDCSTPEQAAMNGQMVTKKLRQEVVMAFPGGEGRSKRTHPLAEFNSWQVHDIWKREENNGHDWW